MNLKQIGKYSACTVTSLVSISLHAEEHKMPNVVLFLVDDMGYSDVQCYGSDYYETPNVNRICSQGVKFTSAYAACALSSPTRASIMTGKNPARLHITHAIPILGYKRINDGKGTPLKDAQYEFNLPLEEETIAEALKEYGYATASIGKWHISENPEFFPEHQGFDINIGGDGHGNTQNYFYPYHNKWRMAKGSPYVEWNTLKDGEEGEYITDRLTNEALSFIEKNKNNKFFLYMSHFAVHTPIQAPKEIVEKYEHKAPDSLRGHFHPGYAAMVETVDNSLGRILEKLEELGISENTIVIFASDNGGHGKYTSNYPFRGNKGNFYEGGLRIPMIFYWPGHITANCNDVPVVTMDLYPTILELAGIPAKPQQHVDGKSLVPLLQGGESLGREDLYWHFPNYTGGGHPNPATPLSVIRHNDYKLIEYLEDGHCELYNLRNDEQETTDLSAQHHKLVAELKKRLDKWRKDTGVQMPGINEDYDPTYIPERNRK